MKKFIKKIEDFACEKCGQEVRGTGYTNHCPTCLYSKHIDINPGDRRELCRGLMKPFGLYQKDGQYFIEHNCVKCGEISRNKISTEDDFDAIIKITGYNKNN